MAPTSRFSAVNPPTALPPGHAIALASLHQHGVLQFDTARWAGLRSATAGSLRCAPDELGMLHEHDEIEDSPRRKNRQRTTGRNANPEALAELARTYRQFICEVVAPHIAEEYAGSDVFGECSSLAFQAVPSLRCATPSPNAKGHRHCDSQYCHQPGQVRRASLWPLSFEFLLVRSHYTRACAQSAEQNDPATERRVARRSEDAPREETKWPLLLSWLACGRALIVPPPSTATRCCSLTRGG